MALSEADKGNEADYFRLGAADILEPNIDTEGLGKVIDRIIVLANKRRQWLEHANQLEKANNELQEV